MATVFQIRLDPEAFGKWVRAECEGTSVTNGRELYRAMVRADEIPTKFSEKTAERWWVGSHAPSDPYFVVRTLEKLKAGVRGRWDAFLDKEYERYRSFHSSPVRENGANKLRGRDSNPQPSVIKPAA